MNPQYVVKELTVQVRQAIFRLQKQNKTKHVNGCNNFYNHILAPENRAVIPQSVFQFECEFDQIKDETLYHFKPISLQLWNKLGNYIRAGGFIPTFKNLLKAHLFQEHFPSKHPNTNLPFVSLPVPLALRPNEWI